VGRKLLWASLALAPATIALDQFADLGKTTLFALSAASLIPLAWLIGEATEHAAEHMGPGIGGFLNASFGNAPELIIALAAVGAHLPEVVRGSLAGSVVSNLLLVLGVTLVAGTEAPLDRRSLLVQVGLIGLAVLAFLVPSVPGFHGDPERLSLAYASIPVAIFLLCVYLAVTIQGLRRHSRLHAVEAEEAEEPAGWPLWVALTTLAVATVATALVSEILVHSLDEFAKTAGLSRFFISAVIVAVVGNAAEHGGAVVVAHRGKMRLATEI